MCSASTRVRTSGYRRVIPTSPVKVTAENRYWRYCRRLSSTSPFAHVDAPQHSIHVGPRVAVSDGVLWSLPAGSRVFARCPPSADPVGSLANIGYCHRVAVYLNEWGCTPMGSARNSAISTSDPMRISRPSSMMRHVFARLKGAASPVGYRRPAIRSGGRWRAPAIHLRGRLRIWDDTTTVYRFKSRLPGNTRTRASRARAVEHGDVAAAVTNQSGLLQVSGCLVTPSGARPACWRSVPASFPARSPPGGRGSAAATGTVAGRPNDAGCTPRSAPSA